MSLRIDNDLLVVMYIINPAFIPLGRIIASSTSTLRRSLGESRRFIKKDG